MLHFEVLGKGSPIVFLHGYMGNLKLWNSFAQSLSQNYQVILIDLPGHGKSENYDETHTMELMAQKVKEVLDKLNLEKATLVGHSMGGYVSLAFAELFPQNVNGLLLLNSTVLPDSEQKKAQRLLAVEAAQKNLDTLIKVSVPQLFSQKNIENLNSEIEFTKAMARETSLQGVTAALRGMRIRPDRSRVLRDLEAPIGIVLGSFDEAVNPDEFRKVIPRKPNLILEELPTGHMSSLEMPDQTLSFINEFMRLVTQY